ncbi:hypothetical protein FA15DRAFT_709471 [Coprinopsis marcescibilis]|uniref:Extracellular membrane protein CFEM domain-containing protein n=1 Tax=Coprinopsis marcescibilis TaxID=230819 RepID=A0A5C3KFP9_COPMA|nr:hypothetical protein FA15DRAFT_709471 [Coprinopsis marcescibilis]
MFSNALWLLVLAATSLTNAQLPQRNVLVNAVRVPIDGSLHPCIRNCLAGTPKAVFDCEDSIQDGNLVDQACACGVVQYPYQYTVCLENVCPVTEVTAGLQALEDLCEPLDMVQVGTTSAVDAEYSVTYYVLDVPIATPTNEQTTTSLKSSGPTQAPIWAAPIAVAAFAAHMAI